MPPAQGGLWQIFGLGQGWSLRNALDACVFSHRIRKPGSSCCQRLQSFCAFRGLISDYIHRTPARAVHKASIHGLWQGLPGNCRAWAPVIVSPDKNILWLRSPLKIEAGWNFSSTPWGIKKKSVTSPRLFIKSVHCRAAEFLDKSSFRTLCRMGRGESWTLHWLWQRTGWPTVRCGMLSCKLHWFTAGRQEIRSLGGLLCNSR